MTKQKVSRILKRCHVCEDVALAFNFNAITCDSCRNFFRRNANRHKQMRCDFDEKCVINVDTRRKCQRCRMDKCLAIGMKLEQVSKNAINKKRPITKLKEKITDKTNDELIGDSILHDDNQISLIQVNDKIQTNEPLNLYPKPFQFFYFQWIHNLCDVFRSYAPKVLGYAQDHTQMFNMQEFLIRKVVTFGQSLHGFKHLSSNDQLIVLKSSFTEIVMLRSLFYYESDVDSFPMRLDEDAQNGLFIRLDLLYQSKLAHLYELHKQLAIVVLEDKDDDVIRDLLCAQIMFKTKHNITRPEYLRYEYSRYCYLLQRHLRQKYCESEDVEHDDDEQEKKDGDVRADHRYATYSQIVDTVTQLKDCYLEMFAQIGVNYAISHSLLEIYDRI